MLRDVHCHLLDCDEECRRELSTAAEASGVGQSFCNCARPDDWERLRAFAGNDPRILPFFGIHPWYAGAASQGWEGRLKAVLAQGPCGVGEIGLDWMHKEADFETQRAVFSRQVDIALELGRPFTVHCLGAWDDLLEILSARRLNRPFIMHAFSGTVEAMHRLLELGAYISFRVIDPANIHRRNLVAAVPVERLLLETDFPYLPGLKPGKVQAGMYRQRLDGLYAMAAEIKQMPREACEEELWRNGSVFTH